MPPKLVSVIIPAKDAEKTIGECLQAVISQRELYFEYEVIVVDDGSQDRTADIAANFGVQVVRQQNAGPGGARNTGVAKARGEILAFTDADCVPVPEWLFHLVGAFDDPQVAGVTGTYRTHQIELIPRFVQQEYAAKYRRTARSEVIDLVDTNSAAYRREIFLANGGFNDTMTVVEDVELSFRLASQGYRLVFAPDAVVYHYHGPDIRTYVRRKFRNGYWGWFLSRKMPRKSVQNTHNPPSQYVQIVLMALILGTFGAGLFWSAGWWLGLACVLLFFLSAIPFLNEVARFDPLVLWVAPLMLILRAASLGFGLTWGIVFPTREKFVSSTVISRQVRFIKRSLDIFGGLLGLMLSSPIVLLAALAIKLDSPGPIFLSQTRVGIHRKIFHVFKLRTMLNGNDDVNNPATEKRSDDLRVTRVGRFLRRWSIDELPQFWNVLVGDMSLVGPRPELAAYLKKYQAWQLRRFDVKPGLTGWWQIHGRKQPMHAHIDEDIYYVENASLRLDLVILWRTISAVIFGEGAI